MVLLGYAGAGVDLMRRWVGRAVRRGGDILSRSALAVNYRNSYIRGSLA